MKWFAGLLDRWLDRIAPLPDFTGPDWLTDHEAAREDWLSEEILHLSADAPTHSESDTPACVSGVTAGSPDPRVTPDGDGTASATVPVGFTDDEVIEGIRSYLRKFYRG